MRQLADFLVQSLLGMEPATWPYTWVVYGAVMLAVAALAMVFVALFAGPVTVVERRVAGRMMSRIGPNRVGPQGVIQWLADGLKCFLKEDLIPDAADGPLFRLAPYLVFAGMFGTFVVLPFGAHLVAADLNVGVLYLFAISSVVVVGILAAGWSSNSKWGLFGAFRSAAQIISYEVPSALSVLTVVLFAGTLSIQGLIREQGGMPWDWFVFRTPFTFAAFFLFFTAALAEGNRTPFDLPEAESELVAGYHTEYSGMRFLFFLFAEWANLWIMSAVATACFLGGWNIPGVSASTIDAATGVSFWALQALSFVIFAAKTSVLVFIVIQLRWTLPRLRIDQLLEMCWKYLVPLSFACLLGVMVWMWAVAAGSLIDLAMRLVMTCLGVAGLLQYARRVRFNYMADRDNYRKMTGKELWYPPYRLP
jgi:NADH-quinone oxidoreductase subunit H